MTRSKEVNYENSGIPNSLLDTDSYVRIVGMGDKCVERLIKDQRGFISILVLMCGMLIFMVIVPYITGIYYGVKHKGMQTKAWMNEALEFAAAASNMNGDLDISQLDPDMAKQYFSIALADILDGSLSNETITPLNTDYYPGPIKITDFEIVSPGETLPNGITARQPGFLATIEVPLLDADLPWVGHKTISFPITNFAVVKSNQLAKK